ncbi:MAG: hypothetical protein KatS3mg111_1131 [Pirellulaceae bacterium]|nr:MAG: hypothetical protein KatS3mg111_1131 [Pirellulaceae bacterium]
MDSERSELGPPPMAGLGSPFPHDVKQLMQRIDDATWEQLVPLVVTVRDRANSSPSDQRSLPVVERLARRVTRLRNQQGLPSTETLTALLDGFTTAFREASASSPTMAAFWLQAATAIAQRQHVPQIIQLIQSNASSEWRSLAIGLSPLCDMNAKIAPEFFSQFSPQDVSGEQLSVLLDMCNLLTRTQRVKEHPWRAHVELLIRLLNGLVSQLERGQEDPSRLGDSVEQVQKQLDDALALVISLCDALGLIGDVRGVAALEGAMDLKHRRIQVEAAAALARLDHEGGRERLFALAADRIARRRAIAYADELGILDQVDPQFTEPVAIAESNLANWLAEPSQFGFAPQHMELVDSRTLFWPGYHEPQPWFLFRYEYQLASGDSFSNIGIAGPIEMAVQADLGNLPVDDIYAVFAGWEVEHETIFEIPAERLISTDRRHMDLLIEKLEAEGYTEVRPLEMAWFFNTMALVGYAQQGDRHLAVVADEHEILAYPTGEQTTAFKPSTVLSLYRGRRLLRAFND